MDGGDANDTLTPLSGDGDNKKDNKKHSTSLPLYYDRVSISKILCYYIFIRLIFITYNFVILHIIAHFFTIRTSFFTKQTQLVKTKFNMKKLIGIGIDPNILIQTIFILKYVK